jgi:hypothetical protein
MKNAEGFKAISPDTYTALADEARMTMQSRLLRLEQNKSRAEMNFKQITHNPNLSKAEQYEAMSKYYDANPVFEPAQVRAAVAKTPLQILREETQREALGTIEPLFGEEPAIRPIISAEGEEITAPPETKPSVLPTEEQIAEYRRLGGSETMEGRAYRREFMESIRKRAAAKPPRPVGYPDAVWDSQKQTWFIIRNGKKLWWRP